MENLSVQEKTFELLNNTQTNWTVNKIPLITEQGYTTDSYGIFRNDNNKHLGTIKKGYQPFQNAILAQSLIQASHNLSDKFRGGFFDGGKKVFYQIQIPSAQINNDTLKRYITALNSHDGSSAISFGSSNEVMSCKNQFYRVHKGMRKVRHTKNAEKLIELLKNDLVTSIENDKAIIENFKRMADTPLDNMNIFKNIIETCFNTDLDDPANTIETQKKNKFKNVSYAIEKELENKGKTLWGLFNGITYFTNHMNVKKDKDKNLMFGTGGLINNKAYDILIQEALNTSVKHYSMS